MTSKFIDATLCVIEIFKKWRITNAQIFSLQKFKFPYECQGPSVSRFCGYSQVSVWGSESKICSSPGTKRLSWQKIVSNVSKKQRQNLNFVDIHSGVCDVETNNFCVVICWIRRSYPDIHKIHRSFGRWKSQWDWLWKFVLEMCFWWWVF